MKGKPHKHWIKMYELCDAKSGYVHNQEVCTVAHPTNPEHKAFSVFDRLCDERDSSAVQRSSTIYGVAKQAEGTVMSNRKEVPKQAFSGELKKGEKYHSKGTTSWSSSGRASVMSFLTTAHEDVLVEAPSSRGHIIK